jgi:EF hand
MKTSTLTLLSIGASLGVTAFAAAAESGSKPPKPPKAPKYHLSFALADADSSGGLTVFEFAHTLGSGTPMIEVRRRFLAIDVEGAFEEVIDPVTQLPAVDPVTGEPIVGAAIPDDLVSLEELKAYRALEVKPKSDLGRFDLADISGDGQLDLDEFGYLVSPKVKLKNTVRKFNKRDTSDDGFISREEFKKPEAEEL